ncbi:hypothetical protein [Tropicimonas marinistellae]|uniref:hypothetical protein n=1 Tax=Tropicimonas marinistellae TaxID=1739787 RepID=UPI0008366765|nr:hypothetical protein [Tropicimonas marinistellae]
MTALKQYARLECPGVWKPEPNAQRQNVIVSFGDASLVICDRTGRPLSHWSLAAVVRINRGKTPALYTPSAEAIETLEIDDTSMVDAIEQVRSALLKSRPRQGRLRLFLTAGAALLTAGALAFWMPGALMTHTLEVVPEPSRDEIGNRLFAAIGRVSGAPCHSKRGDRALARLSQRLMIPDTTRLLVLKGGIPDTVSLPGGTILINSRLVEDHESVEVVAGYILAEDARSGSLDPLEPLLESAGLVAVLRLLTTGHLPDNALQSYAETLTASAPAPVAEEALAARFAAAGLSSTPYAYALDVTGEATLGLIEADPMRGEDASTVLEDGDWVALQQICEG